MEKGFEDNTRKLDTFEIDLRFKLLKFVRQHTTLSKKEFNLIYELLIFLFRKRLIHCGNLEINTFGKFHIFKRKKITTVRFKAFEKMKMVVNSIHENKLVKYASLKKIGDIYQQIYLLTGLRKKHVTFIICLIFNKILELIRDNKFFKFQYFGSFTLHKYNFNKKNFFGKEAKVRRIYNIKFKPTHNFLNEINNSADIKVSKRLKRFLQLNNFENLSI